MEHKNLTVCEGLHYNGYTRREVLKNRIKYYSEQLLQYGLNNTEYVTHLRDMLTKYTNELEDLNLQNKDKQDICECDCNKHFRIDTIYGTVCSNCHKQIKDE